MGPHRASVQLPRTVFRSAASASGCAGRDRAVQRLAGRCQRASHIGELVSRAMARVVLALLLACVMAGCSSAGAATSSPASSSPARVPVARRRGHRDAAGSVADQRPSQREPGRNRRFSRRPADPERLAAAGAASGWNAHGWADRAPRLLDQPLLAAFVPVGVAQSRRTRDRVSRWRVGDHRTTRGDPADRPLLLLRASSRPAPDAARTQRAVPDPAAGFEYDCSAGPDRRRRASGRSARRGLPAQVAAVLP